jgi:hypothetical protein
VTLVPGLKPALYQAWGSAPVVQAGPPTVYALRVTAAVFGHNAPKQLEQVNDNNFPTPTDEWEPADDEAPDLIFLDSAYDKITPGSYLAIQPPDAELEVYAAETVSVHPRTQYGLSSKTTEIRTSSAWWDPDGQVNGNGNGEGRFAVIRGTVVYAQSERLDLAEEPIETPVGADPDDPQAATRLELDALYDGLSAGRWLIVTGERADVPGASGVQGAELVMLAGVEQGLNANLPSDTTHSTLRLANDGLRFAYKRDTVRVYGNVVKGTHGETRAEVLGGGDGTRAFQQFTLRQPPLTYVPAPTPAGAASTLEVRVNELLWHEVPGLAALGPTDRRYLTRTDDGKTSVIFGNGVRGARLPTGLENVKAVYRSGLGRGGNVRGGQISLLMSKPLGVKEVINPLPATGGADQETRDQARENVPLALRALDRLVAVSDYADFARTFAGIGKASAARLSDGRRQVVHVTIAGAGDIPIDANSDLYRNLRLAFYRLGEPRLAVRVQVRELVLLVISARVRLLPDYLWELVEPRLRAALLDAYSFERRALGQDALLSEVVSVMHTVPGVAYVDVELFDSVAEADAQDLGRLAEKLAALAQASPPTPAPRVPVALDRVEAGVFRPAQVACLRAELPETLILEELRL